MRIAMANKCPYHLPHIGGDCVYCERDKLKALVREMGCALKFSTYGSLEGILKRSQEILSRPEVQAIMEDE